MSTIDPMRLLICGSRDWTDYESILTKILELLAARPIDCIIEGEARGADRLARYAAEYLGIPVEPFPADWQKYGKSAGFRRNQRMLEEGKPDLVLAFQKDNSRGTQDMIDRAKKAGVPVRVFTD